jgi:hypothetical protein
VAERWGGIEILRSFIGRRVTFRSNCLGGLAWMNGTLVEGNMVEADWIRPAPGEAFFSLVRDEPEPSGNHPRGVAALRDSGPGGRRPRAAPPASVERSVLG